MFYAHDILPTYKEFLAAMTRDKVLAWARTTQEIGFTPGNPGACPLAVYLARTLPAHTREGTYTWWVCGSVAGIAWSKGWEYPTRASYPLPHWAERFVRAVDRYPHARIPTSSIVLLLDYSGNEQCNDTQHKKNL